METKTNFTEPGQSLAKRAWSSPYKSELSLEEIMNNTSPKLNRVLFPEVFWVARKTEKNCFRFNEQQASEIMRLRNLRVIPKDIAEQLGCGVYKVHKAINNYKHFERMHNDQIEKQNRLVYREFQQLEKNHPEFGENKPDSITIENNSDRILETNQENIKLLTRKVYMPEIVRTYEPGAKIIPDPANQKIILNKPVSKKEQRKKEKLEQKEKKKQEIKEKLEQKQINKEKKEKEKEELLLLEIDKLIEKRLTPIYELLKEIKDSK